MAQFLKVLAGSKLLFLPFTAVAVAGVGSFYVSYNVSRWTTAKALRVDPDHLSTVTPQPHPRTHPHSPTPLRTLQC